MDSDDVRDEWAERSGEYSPAYYAHYGPDETSELVCEVLQELLHDDATVLELGCSSGRHLARLADAGFASLAGVDINDDAFDVMSDNYPDLAHQGTFYCDPIEAVITGFEDDQFDAVYSVETLQHVHPDADWVFEEIARVADDVVLTVENERAADRTPAGEAHVTYVRDDVPLYHRNWNRVFTSLGCRQVDVRRTDRDVARAFRPAE